MTRWARTGQATTLAQRETHRWRGYSAAEVFSEEELSDFRRAKLLVAGIPDREPSGEWVRCHELARAVADRLELAWTVKDGHFGRVDHSWLEAPRRYGYASRHVLDVYAVGSADPVALVDASGLLRHGHYRSQGRAPRTDIRHDVIAWLHERMNDAILGPR